jgi:hypothetical protein
MLLAHSPLGGCQKQWPLLRLHHVGVHILGWHDAVAVGVTAYRTNGIVGSLAQVGGGGGVLSHQSCTLVLRVVVQSWLMQLRVCCSEGYCWPAQLARQEGCMQDILHAVF